MRTRSAPQIRFGIYIPLLSSALYLTGFSGQTTTLILDPTRLSGVVAACCVFSGCVVGVSCSLLVAFCCGVCWLDSKIVETGVELTEDTSITEPHEMNSKFIG